MARPGLDEHQVRRWLPWRRQIRNLVTRLITELHPPAHRSAGLVTLVTPPSTPCPRQPLPPPRSSAHVITIYGRGIRRGMQEARWGLLAGVGLSGCDAECEEPPAIVVADPVLPEPSYRGR